MKKKALQLYNQDNLNRYKSMTPDEIVVFLENFRELTLMETEKCKLISMKIPPSLLNAFKAKAKMCGIPYQTQIKSLMRKWLESSIKTTHKHQIIGYD